MAHALSHYSQAPLLPEPAPKRAALTLVDRLDDIAFILDTLESLDDTEHSPSFREELERELVLAIAGTREKIDRTARALAALEAAEEAAASEMKRLAQRRDTMSRQADRLRSYVLATLEASNLKKLDGHTATLAARKNPPSVCIDDESVIPESLKRFPPPPAPVPDKTAIKCAIQAGTAVPGARLLQTVRLVRS